MTLWHDLPANFPFPKPLNNTYLSGPHAWPLSIIYVGTERLCREELGRHYLMEIMIIRKHVELLAWYDRKGYMRGVQIPNPAPEIVKEGCDASLQLMSKHVV